MHCAKKDLLRKKITRHLLRWAVTRQNPSEAVKVKRCRGGDVEEMEKEKEMENLRQKNDTGNGMFAQRLFRGDEKHQLLGHNSKKSSELKSQSLPSALRT